MDDTLVSLVYYSTAQHSYSDSDLAQLLEVCRRNNKSCNVTGMLLYHEGNFIQALEGPRSAVMSVFDRAQKDPKHNGVLTTGVFPIERRLFQKWSMGVLHKSVFDAASWKAVNEFLNHQPDETSEDSQIAWRLLNSFRAGVDRAA